MISSISNNRFTSLKADYSQPQSVASTNGPDQKAQQESTLKADDSELTNNKKTGELSDSDLKVVSELKQRDAQVRAHEAAHLAAAGGIATSGASFEYQQGPDGIRYAIGGEVNIDTSPVPGDPAATLRKADIIRRAALTPAEPSSQDMQVAASATAMAAQAQTELLLKNQNTQNGNKGQLGNQIDLSA